MRCWITVLVTSILVWSNSSSAQFADRLEPRRVDYGPGKIDAADKRRLGTLEGKTAVVCGHVNKPPYKAENVQGRPTYLILGEPSLQDFRVKILEKDLGMFADLNQYFGKTVCVSGEVRTPKINKGPGVPEIAAYSARQISIEPNPKDQGRYVRPCVMAEIRI